MSHIRETNLVNVFFLHLFAPKPLIQESDKDKKKGEAQDRHGPDMH